MELNLPNSNTTHQSSSNDLIKSFKIVRLAEGDVSATSDHLNAFRNLILANEPMYPAIADWFRRKVVPGIRYSERVAFVGYLDEKPVVSALVKKGDDAKFCHLRVDDALQDAHLGELFFSVMALEIRDLAKSIHFSLPESLWASRKQFFNSFGFLEAEAFDKQYRLFDTELFAKSSFADVWSCTLEKLPKLAHLYECGGFSSDTALLLSIRPEFAEKIFNKTKTVELRRKFSMRWLGHRINIYASAPVMSLLGEARISGITRGTAETIWSRFSGQLGCTQSQFNQYAEGADELFALELDEVKPYRDRVPLGQISRLINEDLSPPQSYCTLEPNRAWGRAISVVSYLHACLRSTLPLRLIREVRRKPFKQKELVQSELKL